MTDNFRNLSIISMIGIVAVMALATFLSFIVTGSGLALESDGYYYVNAARILSAFLGLDGQTAIDGELLREIISHYAYTTRIWPPFYPTLLTAVSVYSDPYPAARWLHLTFPAIIAGLLWLLFRQNNKTNTHAFTAIALIILSPYILWLNWFVYSEIPFLILQLSVLSAVSWYLLTRRAAALVLAIACIALACLTRYIGVVMVPVLAVTVWRVNSDLPLCRRIALSLSCILFSLLPVTLYTSAAIVHSGETVDLAGRSFAWYGSAINLMIFLKNSLYSPKFYLTPIWWPPQTQMFFVLFAAAAIFIILVRQAVRQRRQPPPQSVLQLQGFIMLCLAGYFLLVFVYALLLDPIIGFTGLSPRLFAPLFVWAVVLFVLIGPDGEPAAGNRSSLFMTRFSSIFVAALIMIYLVGSVTNALKNRDIAATTHSLWKSSAALAYVRTIDETPWIVSNMPGEVFHYTKIPAFELPKHYDFVKDRKNENHAEQMAGLREFLHRHNGVLLYFDPYFHLPREVATRATSLKECLDLLDLEIYLRGESGYVLLPR